MYFCEVQNSGAIRFFQGVNRLHLSDKEIYALAQTESFSGNREISAFPAEVGLRITAQPPNATLALIARPKRGSVWVELNPSQAWIDDGVKIAFVSPESVSEVMVELALSGFNDSGINFRDTALLSTKLGQHFFVDLQVSDWDPVQSVISHELGEASHTLKVKLHDYQEWSVSRLTDLCSKGLGAVLADEMGLGKTVQSIAVILAMVNQGGTVLVVVPSVLITNWLREFAKFAPTLKIGVHHRPSLSEIEPGSYADFDVVLTAFSTVTSTKGDLHLFNTRNWDLVVVDEAQFIKNPDAKRAIAVKELSRKSSLALSGTPVENSPLDIWSIAEFIFPTLLGERQGFDTQIDVSDEALDKVKRLLMPLLIRRRLEDVSTDLTLPERIEENEFLSMSPEKVALQREILDSPDGNSQAKFNSLLLLAAEAHVSDSYGTLLSSPKFRRLKMLVSNAFDSDEKLIVFCRYRATLDRIREGLLSSFSNFTCEMIRGDSGSSEERQEILDRFSRAKRSVLLLNPDAAGFGLNITAANHVVHFHPLWNPAKTDQATKRAHRPGQEKVTKVHHLIYQGSVEEAILERSVAKRAIADLLIGEEFDQKAVPDIQEVIRRVQGYASDL